MFRPPVRLGGPVLRLYVKIVIVFICYWGRRIYSGVAGVCTAAFISAGWILSSNIVLEICSVCAKCKASNIVTNKKLMVDMSLSSVGRAPNSCSDGPGSNPGVSNSRLFRRED